MKTFYCQNSLVQFAIYENDNGDEVHVETLWGQATISFADNQNPEIDENGNYIFADLGDGDLTDVKEVTAELFLQDLDLKSKIEGLIDQYRNGDIYLYDDMDTLGFKPIYSYLIYGDGVTIQEE